MFWCFLCWLSTCKCQLGSILIPHNSQQNIGDIRSYIIRISSYIYVRTSSSIKSTAFLGRLGEFSCGFSGISGQLFWKEPRKQLLLYYRHLKTIATIKMIMAYLRVHGEKIFVGPCYNTVSSYHKHHNNWNQSSKPGISEKENDKILHRFVWSSDDLKFRSIVY